MRFVNFVAVLLLSAQAAFSAAAEFNLKVLDPHAAVVQGARVVLYPAGSSLPAAARITGPDGIAAFTNLPRGRYRAEVLAAGFARASEAVALPAEGTVTIRLAVAASPETVVVSAARTPLPGSETGLRAATMTGAQIELLDPVDALEALRFMPGAIVSEAGRRGGLGSLFVRGGESRYNKVIIDGVAVNEPGGTFDFGVVPMQEFTRVEFVRGAESTLYGSDAMASVVQFFSQSGSAPIPQLRFGSDGGTFATAHGYASLSGARDRFDYNFFGDQFHTEGQGANDEHMNSSQGANIGISIPPRGLFRFRTRHSNSRTGVQSFWNFNGRALLPPDSDQFARQNNFLASAELTLAGPSPWEHRITAFEYNHKRTNVDTVMDAGRASPLFGNFDFPFHDFANINRAGLEYQGDYLERSWARTTFGYRFEDENGFVGDLTLPPLSHGLRLNHAVYGEQVLTIDRLSLVGGIRFEHNESFGNKAVPRISASALALRGGQGLSGTRLRFAYSTGIKEPRLEESFGVGGFGIIPNRDLKAEENRSLEAGVQQSFLGGKYSASAAYFNNRFTNLIDFSFDPATFTGQYVNLNESLAHGAELELEGRPTSRVSITAGYSYVSTQILKAPLATDPLKLPGRPLLRRPKHAGSLLVSYIGSRLGGSVGTTVLGRRADSDFLGLVPPVTYSAGYARVDLGGWYAISPRITAYLNVGNALNRHYEEAAGYPALRGNFRAGMRFRIGGE